MLTEAYPVALYCCLMQCGQIPHHESLWMALATHNKYSYTSLNLVCYFELDLLDEILGHEKLAMYHREHHGSSMQRYSFIGVIRDHDFYALDGLLSRFMALDMSSPRSAMGMNTSKDK